MEIQPGRTETVKEEGEQEDGVTARRRWEAGMKRKHEEEENDKETSTTKNRVHLSSNYEVIDNVIDVYGSGLIFDPVDCSQCKGTDCILMICQVIDHSVKVASHYNRLQEVGLAARSRSRIFFMSSFKNYIYWLEGGSPQISVLDLGCGKGGDLLKWRRGGISHLVCADIAGVSVEQCQSRYEEMKKKSHMTEKIFSAQFITADCTKEVLSEKLDDPELMFDICSCQFVYHYSFESEQKANMMLRNACERLKPGGFFIGTTPDAFELVKRLEASGSLSFGNEVFKVSFQSKGSYSLFGCQYHFSLEDVVNVPEFLVYFPLLEHMAKHYNMRLVLKQRFSEYFMEKVKKEHHRSLMMKMMALEPFPCEEGGQQATDSRSEYCHAKEHCGGTGIKLPLVSVLTVH
uniref:mRNA (guanine-N(7))-methyltransferase n=1 Tax=Monopterus albus TaxID=43700 RepID=A0A3Q3JBN4_MONAL